MNKASAGFGKWPLSHARGSQLLAHKKKKLKTCTVFLPSYRNTSGSLGEREMLWEHEPTGECFHSSKLPRVFLQLDRNTENTFSISFRKFHDE